MAFWLAQKRTVQQTDTIQRFDPRFWTVDFPRPAMACVTTTASDALRVDAVFRKADDLIGQASIGGTIRCSRMKPRATIHG
jgi:hypothetical protein